MQPFGYRIFTEWSAEDEAYVARVPALGAAGHGETPDEATKEAQLAAQLMLDVLREDGKPAPPEDAVADHSGKVLVRMPRSLHEQLARRASAEGVSLNQQIVSLLSAAAGLGPASTKGSRVVKVRRGEGFYEEVKTFHRREDALDAARSRALHKIDTNRGADVVRQGHWVSNRNPETGRLMNPASKARSKKGSSKGNPSTK